MLMLLGYHLLTPEQLVQVKKEILLRNVPLVKIRDAPDLVKVRTELISWAGYPFRLIKALDFTQVLLQLKECTFSLLLLLLVLMLLLHSGLMLMLGGLRLVDCWRWMEQCRRWIRRDLLLE